MLVRFLGLALVFMICVTPSSRADSQLGPRVIASGGGVTSSAVHTVDLTIGQSNINVTSSSNFSARMGFWEQVDTETAIGLPTEPGTSS